MRLKTFLFALLMVAGCGGATPPTAAATTPPAAAASAPKAPSMSKLTSSTDDAEGGADKPVEKPVCAPSAQRACSDVCDGNYGLLCFYGTVCDPIRHYCEKAQP